MRCLYCDDPLRGPARAFPQLFFSLNILPSFKNTNLSELYTKRLFMKSILSFLAGSREYL